MSVKQIVGIIFLTAFLSFLGYKFYNAVRDVPHASLIFYLSFIIIIVMLFAIRKLFSEY